MYQKGRISSLQGHGQSLKEMFDFYSVILSPSAGIEAGDVFEVFDGLLIPSPEGLYNKRLESDALRTAVVKVGAIFGRLPHFDGGSSVVSGAVKNSVLRGRNYADIKRNFPSIHPIADVNICLLM